MPKRGEVTVIEHDGDGIVDLRGWARIYAREVLDQHARAERSATAADRRAQVLHELPKAG